MSLTPFLIAIGGFFGAMTRYGLSQWSNKRWPSVIPVGTLFINLSGSFLARGSCGRDWDCLVSLLLGTGFMGAYTTFSTFYVENVQLVRKKEWKALTLYVGFSYTAVNL